MDSVWLAVLTAALTEIATLIVVAIWNWVTNWSKKAKYNKKKDLEDTLKESIRIELQPITKSVEEIKHDTKLISTGTQASLRNDLENLYKHCVKYGYKSEHDVINFLDMYDAYIDLGGNSYIVNDIKPAFENLPREIDYKVVKNNTIKKRTKK